MTINSSNNIFGSFSAPADTRQIGSVGRRTKLSNAEKRAIDSDTKLKEKYTAPALRAEYRLKKNALELEKERIAIEKRRAETERAAKHGEYLAGKRRDAMLENSDLRRHEIAKEDLSIRKMTTQQKADYDAAMLALAQKKQDKDSESLDIQNQLNQVAVNNSKKEAEKKDKAENVERTASQLESERLENEADKTTSELSSDLTSLRTDAALASSDTDATDLVLMRRKNAIDLKTKFLKANGGTPLTDDQKNAIYKAETESSFLENTAGGIRKLFSLTGLVDSNRELLEKSSAEALKTKYSLDKIVEKQKETNAARKKLNSVKFPGRSTGKPEEELDLERL